MGSHSKHTQNGTTGRTFSVPVVAYKNVAICAISLQHITKEVDRVYINEIVVHINSYICT